MATQISKHFTLEQLTATSFPIKNIVPSSLMNNLRILGEVLDFIYDNVGPFKLISVYRSQELQDYIRKYGSETEKKQAVAKSYHSTAQAADIAPTTMSVVAFMAKIAQSPQVLKKIGAFAIKSGNVHIDTETSTRVGVALKATSDGSYVRLTASELKNLISGNPLAAAGIGILSLITLGLAGYLVYTLYSRKK